jgi:tetratricopeptide (TPR) repeat protein
MARRFLIGLALGLLACRRQSVPAPVSAEPSLADQARALIAQGDTDTALARLQGADQGDGEVLYLEGLAWAHKAETAPTPDAGGSASVAHGAARPPDLKPEEEKALSFLEKAVAARPDLAAAHIALADLLGPHALRREGQERVRGSSRSRGSGARRGEDPPVPGDSSIERVLQAYRRGAQADPVSKPMVEAWIDFARRAGRLEEADAAFQQLLLRDKENAAPLLRYGDFLLGDRKDEVGAISAYSRALIWQPNLEEARARIADIYLAQSAIHFNRKEYASAEARLADSRRFVGPAESPQAARLRRLESQLSQIRGR